MRNRSCLPFRSTDFTSGFHRGSCCPVICVSLFYMIVLSFGFWVLIVAFVWLLGIYIFFTLNLLTYVRIVNCTFSISQSIFISHYVKCNAYHIVLTCSGQHLRIHTFQHSYLNVYTVCIRDLESSINFFTFVTFLYWCVLFKFNFLFVRIPYCHFYKYVYIVDYCRN